uniref:Uncharacterized protein n=1 Tax=Octopus bimaculoides TaxID=37653 RepID=A0A0L8I2Z7_OCTBM
MGLSNKLKKQCGIFNCITENHSWMSQHRYKLLANVVNSLHLITGNKTVFCKDT